MALHLVQRGNNRGAIFFADEHYARYRDWLTEAGARHGYVAHAYVLMTNHVHLLLTPARADSMPLSMLSLGRRHVRYINQANRRRGTLWEGRYKAAAIDSEHYMLACYRYIEINPVRAGMVAHPGDYRWSSYWAHAQGEAEPTADDHWLYRYLGQSDAERQCAYRSLFRTALPETFGEERRAATHGGCPLGSDRFKREIADALRCRVAPRPPGRPRTGRGAGSQLELPAV